MILAIDPSINHVGWATWDKKLGYKQGTFNMKKVSRNPTLYRSCFLLCSFLRKQLTNELKVLIVEKPSYMSSAKGQIASQEGYTLNLAFINGYVISHFIRDYFNPSIYEYVPRTWKGQVRKAVTLAKFKRKFPKEISQAESMTDHEIDARMMIYYHLHERQIK